MLHAEKGNFRESVLGLLDDGLKRKTLKPVELALRVSENVPSGANVFDATPKELREQQVKALKALGYPARVLKLVAEPLRGKGLLVIPSTVVSLECQMRLLGIDTDRADIWGEFDQNEKRKSPYWISGIKEGVFEPPLTTTGNVTGVREILKGQGRRGLTFAEGLALYAQNPIWFLSDSELMLFGAAPEHAPQLTIFQHDPIVVGPNNYYGVDANHSRCASCTD